MLPIDHILTPPAQRAILGHFGQMPPAATAFVVGGFGCSNIKAQNIFHFAYVPLLDFKSGHDAKLGQAFGTKGVQPIPLLF